MKTNSIKAFSLKGILTKVVVTGALAAAFFMAAPQKAEAQGFRIGVQIGHPYYSRPYYGRPYYAPPVYGPVYGPGFYAERRHEEWLRHERFEHDRRFYGR